MTEYISSLRKYVGHAPILQCGASVELVEVVEYAAKRELFEETGLSAKKLELFGVFSGTDMHYVYPNGDEVSNVDIVYLCREYSGELNPNRAEVDELSFFTVDILPDNISSQQRKPLNAYVERFLPEASRR